MNSNPTPMGHPTSTAVASGAEELFALLTTLADRAQTIADRLEDRTRSIRKEMRPNPLPPEVACRSVSPLFNALREKAFVIERALDNITVTIDDLDV